MKRVIAIIGFNFDMQDNEDSSEMCNENLAKITEILKQELPKLNAYFYTLND